MLSRLKWLSLSKETRKILSILLNIPKTGGTEVVNNRVVCDGYTDKDLATVTIENLQAQMQSESKDFYELFDGLVERIEAPMQDIKVEDNDVVIEKAEETSNTEPLPLVEESKTVRAEPTTLYPRAKDQKTKVIETKPKKTKKVNKTKK